MEGNKFPLGSGVQLWQFIINGKFEKIAIFKINKENKIILVD